MDHPNIAKVLDGGATGAGRPYFVMDLVKGEPITKYCDDRRLTPRERLELFIPVCQAIQHAHQKGIIHRDLKPSNVLVALYDGKPVPKVIDFGIAKAAGPSLTDKTLVTGFGAIVGTFEYMSPEQAEINQLDIDTRSDIYSLGVLLYELLTGGPPLSRKGLEKAGMLEMLRVIREEEPTTPSAKLSTAEGLPTLAASRGTEPAKLARLVRGELDWIVMKALEKDRSRRYETANGLAMDLQRYLADEPVLACPPSVGYRVRKIARRHRGPVVAGALVALALVGGIIGTTWGMLRATDAEADAVNEAHEKTAVLKEKEAALAGARDKLFLALVNQARADRSSGRVGQRFVALKAVRQAAQMRITPELRTQAAAALVLPDVEVTKEWQGWPEDTVGVAFDAAFERYARLDKKGGVAICRAAEREEVLFRLPSHGQPRFDALGMSPDGRFVIYRHSKNVQESAVAKICIWRLEPSPDLLFDEPVGYFGGAWAFDPASRRLAIAHADNSIWVLDLAAGKRLHRTAVAYPPDQLAFHPHENRLAATIGEAVLMFDTETGQELPALRHAAPVTWTQTLAWRPDGRRLAVGCNDGKIHVWDVETATQIMSFGPESSDLGKGLRYNGAGDRLVTADWSGQTQLWDAHSGRILLTIPNCGLQLGSDDRVLGAGRRGEKLCLWRLANGRELRVLRRAAGQRQQFGIPVVHPDGRMLAACSEGWLSFFDLIDGEELASIKLPRAWAACPVSFDPPRADLSSEEQDRHAAGGWVTGGSQLFLWPVRPEADRPEVLRIGPPELIAAGLETPFGSGVSASADGRVFASPQGDKTVLVHRDHPERLVSLGPQFDVRFSAVSPDGRWVATGSHWEDGNSKSLKIWEAANGEKAHELPLESSTTSRFSPDGRWLMTATSGVGCRLWEVGSWREARRFDYGPFAFSPDGRLLAIGDVVSVIRFVETATGREVGRLTGPDPQWYRPDCFTPDGGRLISSGPDPSALYVWDLRAIRKQLKELDLDWKWPEFKPEPDRGPPPEVRIEGAELLEVTDNGEAL
jgi:WD40 repeat protein